MGKLFIPVFHLHKNLFLGIVKKFSISIMFLLFQKPFPFYTWYYIIDASIHFWCKTFSFQESKLEITENPYNKSFKVQSKMHLNTKAQLFASYKKVAWILIYLCCANKQMCKNRKKSFKILISLIYWHDLGFKLYNHNEIRNEKIQEYLTEKR